MAKKKKKGVKNPKEPVIYAFDLELSSKDELKRYIASLEKELALMQKDCDFYSLNKDKIMEFLETLRRSSVSRRQMSVVDNAAMDEFIERLRNFPVKFNEKKLISDREKARMKQEKVFHDFVVRSSAETGNFEEEHFLKELIADKDRCLEFDQFLWKTITTGAKETLQNTVAGLDRKSNRQFGNILHENINHTLKCNQDFSSEKMRLLISMFDIDYGNQPDGKMCESYVGEMRRMQNFFHEIASNNKEVIKTMRRQLADLQVENQKINLALKQVLKQNMALRSAESKAYFPTSSDSVPVHRRNLENTKSKKNLERLIYTNGVLSEKLGMLKENLQKLQKRFINQTRQIYQMADFKSHVLEEIIRLNLLMETMETEADEHESEASKNVQEDRKLENKDDLVNIFSMRVESSDTLFVPPIYDDFWNSNK